MTSSLTSTGQASASMSRRGRAPRRSAVLWLVIAAFLAATVASLWSSNDDPELKAALFASFPVLRVVSSRMRDETLPLLKRASSPVLRWYRETHGAIVDRRFFLDDIAKSLCLVAGRLGSILVNALHASNKAMDSAASDKTPPWKWDLRSGWDNVAAAARSKLGSVASSALRKLPSLLSRTAAPPPGQRRPPRDPRWGIAAAARRKLDSSMGAARSAPPARTRTRAEEVRSALAAAGDAAMSSALRLALRLLFGKRGTVGPTGDGEGDAAGEEGISTSARVRGDPADAAAACGGGVNPTADRDRSALPKNDRVVSGQDGRFGVGDCGGGGGGPADGSRENAPEGPSSAYEVTEEAEATPDLIGPESEGNSGGMGSSSVVPGHRDRVRGHLKDFDPNLRSVRGGSDEDLTTTLSGAKSGLQIVPDDDFLVVALDRARDLGQRAHAKVTEPPICDRDTIGGAGLVGSYQHKDNFGRVVAHVDKDISLAEIATLNAPEGKMYDKVSQHSSVTKASFALQERLNAIGDESMEGNVRNFGVVTNQGREPPCVVRWNILGGSATPQSSNRDASLTPPAYESQKILPISAAYDKVCLPPWQGKKTMHLMPPLRPVVVQKFESKAWSGHSMISYHERGMEKIARDPDSDRIEDNSLGAKLGNIVLGGKYPHYAPISTSQTFALDAVNRFWESSQTTASFLPVRGQSNWQGFQTHSTELQALSVVKKLGPDDSESDQPSCFLADINPQISPQESLSGPVCCRPLLPTPSGPPSLAIAGHDISNSNGIQPNFRHGRKPKSSANELDQQIFEVPLVDIAGKFLRDLRNLRRRKKEIKNATKKHHKKRWRK